MKGYNNGENMNSNINNNKLYNRNFQNINNRKDHNKNLDRIFSERNFEKKKSSDSDDDNYGEITGNKLANDGIDKGMPMRSQYNPKKPIYDSNKYLDFNLFKEKQSKLNVGYSDDTNNNYSSFADIQTSMTSITQQVNPDNVMTNSLEDLGTRLFKNMYNSLPNNDFVISTYGIYTLFASVFLLSNGNTEHESKKFFNYPEKKILNESLIKLTNNLKNGGINIKNFFIYGNNIPHNGEFLSSIENFCIPAPINIYEPKKEAVKLTYIINKLMDEKMRNPVTPSTLENLQVMLMTTAVIHPKWKFPFERIAKGYFYGYENEKKLNYLISYGKVFNYFEDNEHQLVELNCSNKGNDRGICFGIILHKNNQTIETNEKLHFYIEHMKPTSLDEIRIPAFTQDLKFRYNNIIKKMGYQTPFYQITAKHLFPEGKVQLHDIIQNVKIIIDNSSFEKQETAKGYNTIRKFIADKPFFYYFRSLETNTIFINGLFQ